MSTNVALYGEICNTKAWKRKPLRLALEHARNTDCVLNKNPSSI
jgi:hypothetical protein